MGDLLQRALPVDTLVVAVDPGKVQNRVWLSTDAEGLVLDPVTLPVLRPGLDELARLISLHRGSRVPVIAVEATGALHQAWVGELHRRFLGSVRLFARRQRQPPPALSSALDASRPMTGTVPR